MKLYLDDDTVDRRLVAMLRNAGHSVITPSSVNLSGAPDARHFICAIQQALALLTRNHDDFLDPHEVVQAAGGSHAGILMVRSDNDPTRDMTLRQIVAAIAKLASSGVPIESRVFILNHWR
jgi:predicted nuclease of predicted toxin-antitoxin system